MVYVSLCIENEVFLSQNIRLPTEFGLKSKGFGVKSIDEGMKSLDGGVFFCSVWVKRRKFKLPGT
jgi:hypothetical protein